MAPGVKRCDKLNVGFIFRIVQFIAFDGLNGLQINHITLPFKDKMTQCRFRFILIRVLRCFYDSITNSVVKLPDNEALLNVSVIIYYIFMLIAL